MKLYRNLSYEELVALWRREDLRQKASRPTVLFHNNFTPALTSYRWREDDGSTAPESATNLANEDTSYDVNVDSGNVQLFLIIQVEEQGDDSSSNNTNNQLQFDPAGGTTWQNVTASSSNIQGTADANTAATDEAAWATGNFVLAAEEGAAYDGLELTDDCAHTAGTFDYQAANYTEFVMCITVVAADVSDNDTITFALDIGGTTITNAVTPTLTITKTAGGAEHDRTGDDGVFIPDFDERLHGRPRDDAILLGDDRVNEVLLSVLDNILLGDAADLLRLASPVEESDQLLLLDSRFSEALATYLDNLLLNQGGEAVKIETQTGDQVFLDDSIEAFRLKPIQADDQILLKDDALRELDKVVADFLLVSDARESLRERVASDALLLTDAREFALEKLVAETLLLDDARVSTVERTIAEQILLVDLLTKIVERIHLDSLLLDETQDIEKIEGGAQVFTRQVDDALFLLSQTFLVHEHLLGDSILFADDDIRETLKRLLDGLLLGDDRTSALLKTATDALLLGSERRSEIIKTLLDSLLLSDAVSIEELGVITRDVADTLLLLDEDARKTLLTRDDQALLADTVTAIRTLILEAQDQVLLLDQARLERDLQALDGLLLSDQATIEQFGLLLREVADTLLLADTRTSVRELTADDRALLSDLATKLREMITTDDLLLVDTTSLFMLRQVLQDDGLLLSDTADLSRFLTEAFSDSILFNDFVEKSLELTQSERLLLFDSVSTQIIEAVLAALVWAALKARDVMGVKTMWRPNILGTEESHTDALSLQIGYLRNTDLRLVTVD